VPEERTDRVAELLSEGLDSYGLGDIAKAILAWEQALVLDPGNEDAKDYIRTADRRRRPRPPVDPESSPALRALANEARALLRAREPASAFELLRHALESAPASLELQAEFDLARVRMLARYRECFGNRDALVKLAPAARQDLTRFNLPAQAGFLISQIDGHTSVSDLVTLSGLDDFEALHLLFGLCEAGIIEVPK
jgi:tetratricopeptide (TPR) repeat protein